MTKKILITLFFIVNAAGVYAQQYTVKDLIGHWREARHKQANIYFLTDSTGVWVGNDGFLYNKMNYTAKANKDIIELSYTIQIDAKKPKYAHPYIKFLNDSTFLIRFGWSIPNNADTTNKKVAVFVKDKKEIPGAAIKLPTYKDLLGQWVLTFKNEPRESKLNFIDSNRVIKKTATSATLMDYVVDFTKQPITMDFYVGGKLINQTFWLFEGPNNALIEFFDPGKRKDHFTTFGKNYLYKREKPL